MNIIYYIGGPFDQHKVARQTSPERVIVMRTYGGKLDITFPSEPDPAMQVQNHRYFARPVGKTCFGDEVFVATHEDIRP